MFRYTKAFIFIILVLVLPFVFACKKDKNILGSDVQSKDDVLNAQFSDTSTIYAHTVAIDSIASLNDNIKFLGSNQDPVFGRTDVSLYTKCALPNNITNVSFGEDANLVNAEIRLAIRSLDFHGDYSTPLTYHVYEMNTNINADKFYFTNNNSYVNYNNLLGTFTGTFSNVDGTLVIAIPINSTYAKSILNNPQYLLNNTVFQSTFKGFYITCASSNLNPTSTQGVIAKFDLESALSGFYLYYQNGTYSPTKETKNFKFTFSGSNVVRFNEIKHKFNDGATNLLTAQLQGDTAKGAEALYLKGLGGLKVKIKIPYLLNFVSKNKVSINRAELRIKADVVKNGSDIKYPAPAKLALLGIDSTGKEIFTYDQTNTIDFAKYGGTYDYTNNEYVFNIARDVQNIMNGKKKNYGYYLVVTDPDPAYTARRDSYQQRIVLAGMANALNKPVFKITYTPFVND